MKAVAVSPYFFDAQKSEAYIELCHVIYRDDPNWIPPLRMHVMAQFSREFGFYRRKGNAHCHFLATAAGEPVGHVTAMINTRLRDGEGPPIGTVGFFECIHDQSVATDLLGRAIEWLRAGGRVRRVWGPLQFDIWHGYRFMVRGFESPRFFGEPFNKPWYPEFFAKRGFVVRKCWYSLELGPATLARIATRHADAHQQALADGYSFLPVDPTDSGSVASLHRAMEDSYRNFLGWSRLDPGEFREIFSVYAQAVDPRFAITALDPAGRLSGFVIAYPDYGQALRAMPGEHSVLAKLGYHLRSRPTKRAVLFMIGITQREAQRRKGLGRALLHRCLSAMLEAGYESVVVALIAEDSPLWPLLEDRKDESQKEYALFESGL